MWKRTTCAATVVGLAVLASLGFPRGGDARDPKLRHDVRQSGEARFYRVQGTVRRPVWTVSCRMPLRGCVARAPGLVLSVHDDGAVQLIGFAPHGAQIRAVTGGAARMMPDLFDAPVTSETLAMLGRPGNILIVETGAEVISRTALDGVAVVAAYLQWLHRASELGVRDARSWVLPDQTRPLADAPDVMQARAPQDPADWPHYVPRTKPQIEFAIRAQNGGSVYDDGGR